MPMVKRCTPKIGSGPMMVTASPIAPERRPLATERPTSPAPIDSANTNSEKNSHGPNASASEAKGPVSSIRQSPPSAPPMKADHTPTQTERPASPFFVIGKPSKVVATADGVPGMPIKLAVIHPRHHHTPTQH